MKNTIVWLIGGLLLSLSPNAAAATRYVNASNSTPAAPYTNWVTAATTIQEAVDLAVAGDQILVTNGTYAVGGRAVYGTLTNRVAVDKPLTLRSVNGPDVTIIQGQHVPGTTNGDGAIRCAYLADGATLAGFTLTNGATRTAGDYDKEQTGGGVWCLSTSSVVSNCLLVGNSANNNSGGASLGTLINCTLKANSTAATESFGGGAAGSILNACTLVGNSAFTYGGGAFDATLTNCTLTGNSASEGGGAFHGSLNSCTLVGNSAFSYGGGAYDATLTNCTLTGNSANEGGGTDISTLNNCRLIANRATDLGGGASYGSLNSCTLNGNTAPYGGGAYDATLNNCTLTGNSADDGGGTCYGTLYNCIVYFNTARIAPNYDGSAINYSCTTPMPASGIGNISADPQLASASHLSGDSPCRGAGNGYASGTDIDGEPWAVPPSMGCDEYRVGAISGPLSVGIGVAYTNVAVGYPVDLRALIEGRTTASVWSFGGGVVVSNEPYASQAWSMPGDYSVVLTAYNESHPGGVSATVLIQVAQEPVHYVNVWNQNPIWPYTNWATAAKAIQDAVDAAYLGCTILVTNGTYVSGGRAVNGAMTNRVAVGKVVTVRSVNGPEFTVIEGHQVPGTTNGDGAIRCVYLTSGSVLSGFTLTNGATRRAGGYDREQCGGGIWCESTNAIVTNCLVACNSASSGGGGAYYGTLENCTLYRNSAGYGGGATYYAKLNNCTLHGNSAGYGGGGHYGTLNNCTLTANSAGGGGGAYYATLNDCRLTGNSASQSGGGSYSGTLNNCTLTGNSASYGGGFSAGTLNNCTLSDNSASISGGGASEAVLNNCALTGNSATDSGGGVYDATLNNCTLTGNSADDGGGTCYGALSNCIVYFNTARIAPNYDGSAINYSCTTPMPASGSGNISADPQLASPSHLSADSPCRGAGSGYASGTDIDGEPWAVPPSMGCDEYRVGAISGPLSVGIDVTYTNVAVGYPVDLRALIEGRTTTSVWSFGGGVVLSNQPYASHAWNAAGDYPVVLTAFNESHPTGVSATVLVRVAAAPIHYVDANSRNPIWPYTNWVTATRTIQEAVDAAYLGGTVLVTNGLYATGGRAVDGVMANRVAINKPITVKSVNGPQFSVIEGYQVPGTTNGDGAMRCVYLTTGAVLSGFMLTNGATRSAGDYDREQSGGGIWCASTNALVSNCVLANNSACYGGGAYGGTLHNCTLCNNSASSGGGGAYSGTLNDCTLTGNSAGDSGGGSYYSTLNRCALTCNSASSGGGSYSGTLNNCTLSDNSASIGGGGAFGSTLNNCAILRNSGGGAAGGTAWDSLSCSLNNCTVVGNSWGVYAAVANNCILYYNGAMNYDSSTLQYCCTTPLPADGTGNTDNDPQLASASHLSANSPCIGKGSYALSSGVDIDGEPWANPPSTGCDEYWSGSVTGALSVELVASYTNVAVGFPVSFQSVINGRISASSWDFGDGVVVSNQPYASHPWLAGGDYVVVLRAYNESYPGGVAASITVHVVTQPVHYVALESSGPVSPYSSWATAATDIQDAVDAAAVPGALVLVSNGVYQLGGRSVYGMTNRVAVTKPLTLQSLNGPAVTSIVGSGPNGSSAVRCVYLTNGAVLAGFTLTNGATQTSGDELKQQSGGGVWCESASTAVSNCVLSGNSAYNSGGGSWSGTLNNCTLSGNSASFGGGACFGTLNNCELRGNSATSGGGAGGWWNTLRGRTEPVILNNCTLAANRAVDSGGGIWAGTLNNCTLTDNSAPAGGGASGSEALSGNVVWMLNCTLSNCTLSGNQADAGGAVYYGTLNNCTLTGNSAGASGGGAFAGELRNCIVYYNAAPDGNYDLYSALNYCCTTPLPANGTNNLTVEPELASPSHLSAHSPCIGRASAAYAGGVDIDGEPWGNPPSIGCDEYWSGSVTGALSARIVASYTNVAVGFNIGFQALIGGRVSASYWDFGDGVVLSNQPWASHAWLAAGGYVVELRAYNESYPTGIAISVTVQIGDQPIHYVALGSVSPVPPYRSWDTAATNIQDAVDAATVSGALVLVSNGVYQLGRRAVYGMSNRVAVTKPLTVQSLNGAAVTSIVGSGPNGSNAVRCVYLTNGAVLAGFTLRNGATQTTGDYNKNQSGGGVWCASSSTVVSNCVIAGNSASAYGGGAYYGTLRNCTLTGNSAWYGGGGIFGTLNNCTLTSNSAQSEGGGSFECTLNNCTLSGNSTEWGGGGAYSSRLNNCIVYYNTDNTEPSGGNYNDCGLTYCCTTPLPNGIGNFTAPPLFLYTNGWGNLRLQSNSPCINAGLNTCAPGAADLDGNPRIIGGTVDVGAYEFQSPLSVISYAWLQHYGLPIDGSADFTDPDHDGLNNWQEWRCQTEPTNALSALRLLSVAPVGTNVTVTWQSVPGVSYFLERCTNLASLPSFNLLATNLPGQFGTTSFTDTNNAGASLFFYRVGVGN